MVCMIYMIMLTLGPILVIISLLLPGWLSICYTESLFFHRTSS